MAQGPGGSWCGRKRVDTGVRSVVDTAPDREGGGWGQRLSGSHVHHLAFWLVRRGGQGAGREGVQFTRNRAEIFLGLGVWDIT